MYGKVKKLHPHQKRVYVKVNSDFDAAGFMSPKSITWDDGHTYRIERIEDFRPADTICPGQTGDCYTVLINGQERHLFFERADPSFASQVGRWFVEVTTTE